MENTQTPMTAEQYIRIKTFCLSQKSTVISGNFIDKIGYLIGLTITIFIMMILCSIFKTIAFVPVLIIIAGILLLGSFVTFVYNVLSQMKKINERLTLLDENYKKKRSFDEVVKALGLTPDLPLYF